MTAIDRSSAPGAGAPALGEKLLLVPGHCDPTVNLYDWYVCVRGGVVEELWAITARGAEVARALEALEPRMLHVEAWRIGQNRLNGRSGSRASASQGSMGRSIVKTSSRRVQPPARRSSSTRWPSSTEAGSPVTVRRPSWS